MKIIVACLQRPPRFWRGIAQADEPRVGMEAAYAPFN